MLSVISGFYNKNNVYPFNWRAPDTLTEILVHVWSNHLVENCYEIFNEMERRNGFWWKCSTQHRTIYLSRFWEYVKLFTPIKIQFIRCLRDWIFPYFPYFPQHSSIENVVSLTTKYNIFYSGIAIIILIYFSVRIIQYRNVSGAVSIPIFLSKNAAHAIVFNLSHGIYLCENEKPNSLYYFAERRKYFYFF